MRTFKILAFICLISTAMFGVETYAKIYPWGIDSTKFFETSTVSRSSFEIWDHDTPGNFAIVIHDARFAFVDNELNSVSYVGTYDDLTAAYHSQIRRQVNEYGLPRKFLPDSVVWPKADDGSGLFISFSSSRNWIIVRHVRSFDDEIEIELSE